MSKTARYALAAGLALSVALLGGCGAPDMRTVQAAKSKLIGQDVRTLRNCIGEPLKVERTGTSPAQVWTYSSAQKRGADGSCIGKPGPSDAAHDKACVFTFTVVDGRITAVDSDNRAGWGFGSITKCSALVERCVKRSGT